MGRSCTAFGPTYWYVISFRKISLAAVGHPDHIVQRGIVVVDEVPYVF
jgi:hypothetical protein